MGISSTRESGYASISSSFLKHPVGTGTLETSANADTLATAMSMNDILFFVSGSGTFLFSARMQLWQAKFLACK